MTKRKVTYHPASCRCRACTATQRSAPIGHKPRRFHPIATVLFGAAMGWAAVGVAIAIFATQ